MLTLTPAAPLSTTEQVLDAMELPDDAEEVTLTHVKSHLQARRWQLAVRTWS